MDAVDVHLQDKEMLKLKRQRKKDTVTGATVEGDHGIGELVQKLIILYLMAIDPHGRFGCLLMRFFFGMMPRGKMTLKMTVDCTRSNATPRLNAARMYHYLVTSRCPR